jgi:hypothetical protein
MPRRIPLAIPEKSKIEKYDISFMLDIIMQAITV